MTSRIWQAVWFLFALIFLGLIIYCIAIHFVIGIVFASLLFASAAAFTWLWRTGRLTVPARDHRPDFDHRK